MLFLPACGGVQTEDFGEKFEFYEVALDGETFYFSYPASAIVSERGDIVNVFYRDCDVDFELLPDVGVESYANVVKKGQHEFRLETDDNEFVSYVGIVNEGRGFWTDGEDCVDLVNQLTESFSSNLGYVNKKYGFTVNLPADFKVEYLGDGEGVLLKKWVEREGLAGYKVEIVFLPFEDLSGAEDVADYVGKKYPGFSFDFLGDGIFVDEGGTGGEAVRHYFLMKGSTIYEAYMKVPSIHYGAHKQFFDELAGGIKIL